MIVTGCSGSSTHSETLRIDELKKDSEEEHYNYLVSHVYSIERRLDSDSHDLLEGHDPLFEKLAELEGLSSFKLSFATGQLPLEKEFRLKDQLPKFGSFLSAESKSLDSFVNLGLLLGGVFSFANGRITEFESYHYSPRDLFWYSYNIETFCVQQLFKLRRIYPTEGGLLQLLISDDRILFRNPYVSLQMDYEIKENIQRLNITMRTAIPVDWFKEFANRKVKGLESLDWTDQGEPPKSKIELYNHYLEKTTVEYLDSSQDEATTLWDIIKKAKKEMAKAVIPDKELSVSRFVLGSIEGWGNTIVTMITSNKSTAEELVLITLTDSHQQIELNQIYAEDASGAPVEVWVSYYGGVKKPNGSYLIGQWEVRAVIQPGQTISIKQPYRYIYHNVNEYEQEFERGTYLLGSQLITASGNINLAPVLLEEHQVDSTFAFTSLTLDHIVMFLTPISIMFSAISSSSNK